MGQIVYTAFGKDTIINRQVLNLAQEYELEYRENEDGLVVFFDDSAQRSWFCNQVRVIKVVRPNMAVNIDIDERYLDYFNGQYAQLRQIVLQAIAPHCPNGQAGIYSLTQNLDPESKQGRCVERFYFITFRDQDCIETMVQELIEDLVQATKKAA